MTETSTRFRGRHGASASTTAGLVLALLAACPGGGDAEVSACPPHDTLGRVRFLAHPRDCSMFLRCHQGREVPGRCPPGTAFLRDRGVCGDPARSSCAACAPTASCGYHCSCMPRRDKLPCPASSRLSVLLHVSEAGCHRDDDTFPLLGNKLGRVEAMPGASNFAVRICPEGPSAAGGRSLAPHFADCSRVLVCEEGGGQTESECPAGWVFSRDTGLCEEAAAVNCSTPAQQPQPRDDCHPGAALLACRYSCDCPAAPGRHQPSCPPSLQLGLAVNIFDGAAYPACLRVEGATSLGEQYVATGGIERNSTWARYCPAAPSRPVYVAHPTDCESFIVCWRGVQSVRRCPAGRQYNPTTQRCGEPDVSLCVPARQPAPQLQLQEGLRCPTSWACSTAYRGVPHISDCSLFCRCDGARPVLAACPPGMHFSARSQTCEDPAVARCRPTCAQLGKLNGSGGEDKGIWHPKSCMDEDSKLGAKCHLKCYPNYELDGSVRVRCTRQGWASNGVLNIIPACRTPEEIGSNLVSKINESLVELGNKTTEMLFIIDEANRVTKQQFEIQKRLVSSIISVFPLSQQRPAGVATLSGNARVYIRLIQASTCDFLADLRSSLRRDTVLGAGRGGAKRPPDITQALHAVESDIDRRLSSSRALIFLITSKRSRSKPLLAADDMKKGRHFLFTIGVGKYNRKQLNLASSRHKDGSRLFFGLSNVKAARKMIEHITREHSSEEANYCEYFNRIAL